MELSGTAGSQEARAGERMLVRNGARRRENHETERQGDDAVWGLVTWTSDKSQKKLQVFHGCRQVSDRPKPSLFSSEKRPRGCPSAEGYCERGRRQRWTRWASTGSVVRLCSTVREGDPAGTGGRCTRFSRVWGWKGWAWRNPGGRGGGGGGSAEAATPPSVEGVGRVTKFVCSR